MTDSVPTRARRLSLTRAQRETVLGTELLALCQTITIDGSLSKEEIVELRRWLHLNKRAELPSIGHLLAVIERIVEDRVVTSDERRELFIAIEKVLPIDVRDVAKKARRTVEQIEKDRIRLARSRQRQQEREQRELDRPIDHWDFMVAGARFDGRPSVIRRYVHMGDTVLLARDPANKFSSNAIQIRTCAGQQIGFVPEDDAIDMAPFLDNGYPYTARIKKILTGGRYPIPIVVADIYNSNASVPDLLTATDASQFHSERLGKVPLIWIMVGVVIFAGMTVRACTTG